MFWFVALWSLSYTLGKKQDTRGLILKAMPLTMKSQSSLTHPLRTQDCGYSSTQLRHFLGLHCGVGTGPDSSRGLNNAM